MKISQTRPGASASRGRKADQATETKSADQFKTHLQDELASNAPGSAAAMPLAALGSLLAIQEAPNSTSEQRQALLQGGSLLDELSELQVGLTQGWVSEGTLRRLTTLLDRPRPDLDDGSLNQVLDEIEIRARVELAKLENDAQQER